METDFRITSELNGDVLILHTSGYINNVGGEKIAEEFSRHFENGVTRVIMNLEESKVVNSIGVSFLLEVIEKLSEKEGKLIFTNMDPAIEKTFMIMGLFNYAGKEATVASALEGF